MSTVIEKYENDLKHEEVITDAPSTCVPASVQHRELAAAPGTRAQVLPHALAPNPILSALPPVLSEVDTMKALANRGVPVAQDSDVLTNAEKISGLAELRNTYFPTMEAVRFAQRIVAQVHASYGKRNINDPRYENFLLQQGAVIQGKKMSSAPVFSGNLSGAGLILAGPSGCGKTAFVSRLRLLIGQEKFSIQTARSQFWVLPLIVIEWPNCGTLSGFLANVQSGIFSELCLEPAVEESLRSVRGKHVENMTLSLCILLNIGLIVVDGLCAKSQRKEHKEILDFIGTLMQRSGIPTLLLCTYPAFQMISRSGCKQSNFASAAQEFWDLEVYDTQWEKMCEKFWKIGFQDPQLLPGFLPALLWNLSRGNMRIFVAAFSAILHHLVHNPKFTSKGESDYLAVLEYSLRLFKEPLAVLADLQTLKSVAGADLWCYGDYLPFDVFSKIPSSEFEQQIKKSGNARISV